MLAATKVRVQIDGRNFIAEFDQDGNPLRIKERKDLKPPAIGIYEISYWVASSHKMGKQNSISYKVIAAAREKLSAAAP